VRRGNGILVLLLSALFAFPAAAPAATEFGSDLTTTVNGSTNCGPAPASCTLFNAAVHTGNTLPVASPVSGVVTGITLKKGIAIPPWSDLQAHAVHQIGPTTFSRFAPSTMIHPTDAAGFESFNTRFPIAAGDLVGFSATGDFPVAATAPGAAETTTYPNALNPDGTPGTGGAFSNLELMLQAKVEPDADGDGFGDETQDQCPSNASTQGQCPVPTIAPPPAQKKKKKCKKRRHKRAAEAKKRCRKHKR
jgi:pyruvate/2-oxoglutarate dehydrogenase complex dihydrolipoamide acyltransferase (E2) component